METKYHTDINENETIAMLGAAAVEAAKAVNCEPTGRVGYNGACQGDALTEWSASIKAVTPDGEQVRLVAYYYTDNDDDQVMANAAGDGSVVGWVVHHYRIID